MLMHESWRWRVHNYIRRPLLHSSLQTSTTGYRLADYIVKHSIWVSFTFRSTRIIHKVIHSFTHALCPHTIWFCWKCFVLPWIYNHITAQACGGLGVRNKRLQRDLFTLCPPISQVERYLWCLPAPKLRSGFRIPPSL